jgi:hypothetical protein
MITPATEYLKLASTGRNLALAGAGAAGAGGLGLYGYNKGWFDGAPKATSAAPETGGLGIHGLNPMQLRPEHSALGPVAAAAPAPHGLFDLHPGAATGTGVPPEREPMDPPWVHQELAAPEMPHAVYHASGMPEFLRSAPPETSSLDLFKLRAPSAVNLAAPNQEMSVEDLMQAAN